MTHRNNYGAHTIAILTTLEERGTCTARQVTNATGLEYDTARQYLRRCAFRGLVTVDHVGRVPAYTVKPTWRERLEPKKPPGQAEAGNHGGKGNRPRSGFAHDLDELKGAAL